MTRLRLSGAFRGAFTTSRRNRGVLWSLQGSFVGRDRHPKKFVQKGDSGLLYVGGFFARQTLTIAHCLARG
jgi:hypothetical protein